MKKIYKLSGILLLSVLTSCDSINKEYIIFFGQNENNFIYKLHEKNGTGDLDVVNVLNENDYYKYERVSVYKNNLDSNLTAVVKVNAIYNDGLNMNFKKGEIEGSISLLNGDEILDNKYYYCLVDDSKVVTYDNDDLFEFQYRDDMKHMVLPHSAISLNFLYYVKDNFFKYYSLDENGDAYVDFDKVNRSRRDVYDFALFSMAFDRGMSFTVDDSLRHLSMVTNSRRDNIDVSTNYDLPTYTYMDFDENFKIVHAEQYGFSFDISSYVTNNLFGFCSLSDFELVSSVQYFDNITDEFNGYKNLNEVDLNIRKSTNLMDDYLPVHNVNYLIDII